MERRHRRHCCRRTVGAPDLGRGPRLEADRVAPEPASALDGREHLTGARQELPPRRIEVVAVLIVREEHDVDRLDLVGSERRRGRLDQAARVLARRGERWVGQPAQASVLQHGRRASDEGELEHSQERYRAHLI
jgi:hypothetical protein